MVRGSDSSLSLLQWHQSSVQGFQEETWEEGLPLWKLVEKTPLISSSLLSPLFPALTLFVVILLVTLATWRNDFLGALGRGSLCFPHHKDQKERLCRRAGHLTHLLWRCFLAPPLIVTLPSPRQ